MFKLSARSSIAAFAVLLAACGSSTPTAGNWHAYASYSISRVRTNLVADTAGVIRTTHISFGPQALIVSVGYSF